MNNHRNTPLQIFRNIFQKNSPFRIYRELFPKSSSLKISIKSFSKKVLILYQLLFFQIALNFASTFKMFINRPIIGISSKLLPIVTFAEFIFPRRGTAVVSRERNFTESRYVRARRITHARVTFSPGRQAFHPGLFVRFPSTCDGGLARVSRQSRRVSTPVRMRNKTRRGKRKRKNVPLTVRT